VALEPGLPVDGLRALGHDARVVHGEQRVLFGRGQIILRARDSGVLCMGSDGRADGCAAGLA